MSDSLAELTSQISQCKICAPFFESHEPRPVVRLSTSARILIVGQAPGRKVHASGIPFDDPSGDRLRDWMGISAETFYNVEQVAIVPMGFCYPGHGKSGDLPPRKECAVAWREPVLAQMPNIKLTLVIGQYAIDWHLKERKKRNLTETVKAWREYSPDIIPIPHPSPRNNIWLKRNPWFEEDVLPTVKTTVQKYL